MSLKDKLLEDYKTAMKEKDVVRKNVVGMVRAAILQFEKDNKVVLDDSGVLSVIAKEIKKRKDSLPEYIKSGRQDLIDELNREIEIFDFLSSTHAQRRRNRAACKGNYRNYKT